MTKEPFKVTPDGPVYTIDLRPAAGENLVATRAMCQGDAVSERWLNALLSSDGLDLADEREDRGRKSGFILRLRLAGFLVVPVPLTGLLTSRYCVAGYGGRRLALLNSLLNRRACVFMHDASNCTCFDDLSTEKLQAANGLLYLLKTNRQWTHPAESRQLTNAVVGLLRAHDKVTVSQAVLAFIFSRRNATGSERGRLVWGGSGLALLVELVNTCDAETLAQAITLAGAAMPARTPEYIGHDDLRAMVAALQAAE